MKKPVVAAVVVVVGGGIAGMTAALELAPRPVLLVLRGRLGLDGATALAQGGIAAAVGPFDSPAAHADDTLRAGVHRARPEAVSLLAGAAVGAIDWLRLKGVAFDRGAQGFALAREGGHGLARVLHAGGDATGAEVSRALAAAIRRSTHVEVLEEVDADALLTAADGRVAGIALRRGNGVQIRLPAAAVVLATGGVGGLFARHTGPDTCDGTGLALALAVGARLEDLEYIQFHPTALGPAPGAGDGRLGLVTEALRGAGATLRGAGGERLMTGVHPSGDLAPRDVVARAVGQAGGAWLDATELDLAWATAFPTVRGLLDARGLDPARDWIPVVPAVHFHMGGIATDLDGRTSVPGLFAVGEVACSGVHGANRLASNSLLEGVVFGRRVGRAASTCEAVRGRLRYAHAGPALDGDALRALRRSLSAVLGPERELAAVGVAARAMPTDARQQRVARALLAAAAANPERCGAHWPLASAHPHSPCT